MAPLKYPYNWYITYNSEKHGNIADRNLPPYVLRIVHPESSQHQTPSAILHEIRKACASPNRRPGAGVYVEKTDRDSGEVVDKVRYKCIGGKPVRQGARSMRRRKG
jgi:hypothetical protein